MKDRPYWWLLFDADGTLFDYDRAETAALRRSFERIGVVFEPGWVATYRQINSSLWQALERGETTPDKLKVRRFELLLQALRLDYSPAEFSHIYLRSLADCSELVDGAHDVLQALHRLYRIAVVTNGLEAVQRPRLRRSTIAACIADIIISEEIGAAKPSREYFDTTFARIGDPPKQTVLMIGDNWSSDIEGAAQYGLDTCWFNPSRKPRPSSPPITREISSLQELVPWLG